MQDAPARCGTVNPDAVRVSGKIVRSEQGVCGAERTAMAKTR
jgi:hypothetical protein